MFESAELGHKIDKASFRQAVPALRTALQDARVSLYEQKIPVIFAGQRPGRRRQGRDHPCAVRVEFWLQISQEEQLKRFQAREQIAFKRFKITEENWRNREKWDAYQQAVCDMVERTSTGNAPWHLIGANDKKYARVKVLRALCERLEAELERVPAPAPVGKKTRAVH